MYVLLAEHDPALAESIRHLLMRHGIEVGVVYSGCEAGLKLQQDDAAAMAILDAALPGMDGFEILRRLRAGGRNLPVILLTRRNAVEDRVCGLELGADDCLAKPFAAPELVARLKALARRSHQKPVELRLGGLSLDFSAKLARANGREIKLWAREWDILEYLMQHAASVVSREDIIQAVSSSGKKMTRNAVDLNISRIRSKIADAGVTIRTIRGIGYMLENNCS